MFVPSKFKLAVSPLSVNDSTFARVVAVRDDGSLDIELNFNVSQLYAVKNNAFTVNVTTRKDSVSSSAKIKPATIATAGKQMIQNIVKQGQDTKGATSSNVQSIIEFKRGDVLAKLNKESLTKLHIYSEVNSTDILNDLLLSPAFAKFTYVFVSVADAKRSTTIVPVLQRYVVNNDAYDETVLDELSRSTSFANSDRLVGHALKSTSIPMSKAELRYASLIEMKSPAMINADSTHVLATADAIAGVNRYSGQTQHLGELIDSLTLPATFIERTSDDIADNEQVMLPATKFVEYVPFSVVISIPNPFDKKSLANGVVSSYYVTLELLESVGNNTVESITKTLDAASLLNAFYVPKEKPHASAGIIRGARSHLDIKINDDVTSDVMLYKKTLSRVASFGVDSKFESMGNSQRLTNGQLRVTNVHPGSNIHVYRVVPIGSTKVIGTTFTDVVVSNDKRYYNKFVSVSAFTSRAGMTIELRGFSYDVVAVQAVKRDLTLHESTYTAIGDITLITSQNRDQNTTFFYDVDLKENHVYEYSAKLTFKSGITQIFGSAVVEYISFVEGIDTRITDVSITNGIKPDVSFNLLTLIAKSGLDDVAAMLEAQNLKSYFDNDILNERDKLQQLIAHNVVRVNLSEGIREDFGVVTDSLFVDSNFRKRCAAADIDARNIYRYEVTALLRTPETLFEDFVKNKTDPISGKQFSMKPSKFNHPIALSRGNITSPESLKARYGKKPMMFGRVGNVEAVEIAFTRPSVTLSNATAVMSNAKTVSVVWTMSGSPGIVDHFMIVSIVNGVRRIVGTTHPYSSALEGRFIHVLTPADKGYAHYAIVPVLNDYTQLSETLTNNLLIQ